MATWIDKIKKALGIHSPSKVTKKMFDPREICKSYINDGCREHFQVVSDCILDMLMHHIRHYFEVFSLDFNGHYALFNTIIDNRMNYMVHIHNNFDSEDSYLVKMLVSRDLNLDVDKIDKDIHDGFEELLSSYDNYKRFKFDMELLHDKLLSINNSVVITIEKINIPNEVFNTIYSGMN